MMNISLLKNTVALIIKQPCNTSHEKMMNNYKEKPERRIHKIIYLLYPLEQLIFV